MSSSPWASRPDPKLLNKRHMGSVRMQIHTGQQTGSSHGALQKLQEWADKNLAKSCSWDRIIPHTGPGLPAWPESSSAGKDESWWAELGTKQCSAFRQQMWIALQAALAKGGQWGEERDHSSLHSTWESIWNTRLECLRTGDVFGSSVGVARAHDRGWGAGSASPAQGRAQKT